MAVGEASLGWPRICRVKGRHLDKEPDLDTVYFAYTKLGIYTYLNEIALTL